MTSITEGQKVKYVGPCVFPGNGTVGTFELGEDTDIYSGEYIGKVPMIVDDNGDGHFCDLDDLVPISD